MNLLLVKIRFVRDFPGLGESIKQERQKSSETLTELAAKAGISVNHWLRIERSLVKEVPEETLRGVEKSLGVDFNVSLDRLKEADEN
ncbi:MAG: helix-turn-helix transcriptional regulator [Symploca sp. SIO2E6]|nr:helix-turn-helix transcriptional regulator [Symploca sp. SIO2E6]